MKLSDAGELGLLRELEARGLIVGTEHDAAEFPGGLVLTQDALVEGVHFRLDRSSWREVGYKAAAVNLSDLAAMGAAPRLALLSMPLPSKWIAWVCAWRRCRASDARNSRAIVGPKTRLSARSLPALRSGQADPETPWADHQPP
jgi:thiamine-monophosphate kinase